MNLLLSPILPSHGWASSPEKSMSVPSLVLPTVKHSVECSKRGTFQYPTDGCVGKMNHVSIPNIGISRLLCLLRQTHFTRLSRYKYLYLPACLFALSLSYYNCMKNICAFARTVKRLFRRKGKVWEQSCQCPAYRR